MTNIYDQHSSAFSNVSAFVILANGEKVATIAFKFPKDGAGRLWCYAHWIGLEMIRGYANGYGYDKKSAALEAASSNLFPLIKDFGHNGGKPNVRNFYEAIQNIGGQNWDNALRDAGFTVLQAV